MLCVSKSEATVIIGQHTQDGDARTLPGHPHSSPSGLPSYRHPHLRSRSTGILAQAQALLPSRGGRPGHFEGILACLLTGYPGHFEGLVGHFEGGAGGTDTKEISGLETYPEVF